VLVFRDPLNRWMPSRPLWNQHSYHITNVNDDLTIPMVEAPNWRTYNNYRQNVQTRAGSGGAGPQSDITAGVFTSVDNDPAGCMGEWTLRANLCNRGAHPALAAVAGTFYASDPRQPGAHPICTASTVGILLPGECQDVACVWQDPPNDKVDLWFRGDDDGAGRTSEVECKERNNLLLLRQVRCGGVG
jgi:hypothetical protein